MLHHGGAVADREDARMRNGLQGLAHLDETLLIHRQPRLRRPGLRPRADGPEDLVQLKGVAIGATQAAGADFHHLALQVNLDPALRKQMAEFRPRQGVVGDKHIGPVCEQMQRQPGSGSTRGRVCQAVLKRQRQLDAAGAAPDDAQPRLSAALASPHPLPQTQPVFPEAVYGLDRRDPADRAGDAGHGGSGPDVD